MKKRFKILFRIMVLTVICGTSFVIYQAISILKWGEEASPKQADAIIVLGAGVWETGPSPALMGRIRLAAKLYQDGYANNLILSGGVGQHPPSEAEAMYTELLQLGVPKEAMYLEDQATNTLENITYSKRVMDENSWQTAILVTDVFHYKRASFIARKIGLEVTGATVKDGVLYQNQALKFRFTLREVFAWYWYRLKLLFSASAL